MELSVSWPGVSEPGLVHISKLQSHLKHKLQFNMKKKKKNSWVFHTNVTNPRALHVYLSDCVFTMHLELQQRLSETVNGA